MLYPLASVMEKVADLAVTFASLDHLKHLLHDEFIIIGRLIPMLESSLVTREAEFKIKKDNSG